MKYFKNRPFLVITTYVRPSRQARTEKKGWMEVPQNISAEEIPTIVNKINDRMLCEATVIIDITEGKLVKSRFPDLEESKVVSHYVQQFRSMVDQAMLSWSV